MRSISPETLWTIWRDGYVTRAREERWPGVAPLFEGRPPECGEYGGPCIGRPECTAERLQNEAN